MRAQQLTITFPKKKQSSIQRGTDENEIRRANKYICLCP